MPANINMAMPAFCGAVAQLISHDTPARLTAVLDGCTVPCTRCLQGDRGKAQRLHYTQERGLRGMDCAEMESQGSGRDQHFLLGPCT